MARGQIELYVYEVRVHPTSRNGVPVPNETGNSIRTERVTAHRQDVAEKIAQARVGGIVVETTRLDGIKPPKLPRKACQRKPKTSDLAALGLVTAASLLGKDSK